MSLAKLNRKITRKRNVKRKHSIKRKRNITRSSNITRRHRIKRNNKTRKLRGGGFFSNYDPNKNFLKYYCSVNNNNNTCEKFCIKNEKYCNIKGNDIFDIAAKMLFVIEKNKLVKYKYIYFREFREKEENDYEINSYQGTEGKTHDKKYNNLLNKDLYYNKRNFSELYYYTQYYQDYLKDKPTLTSNNIDRIIYGEQSLSENTSDDSKILKECREIVLQAIKIFNEYKNPLDTDLTNEIYFIHTLFTTANERKTNIFDIKGNDPSKTYQIFDKNNLIEGVYTNKSIKFEYLNSKKEELYKRLINIKNENLEKDEKDEKVNFTLEEQKLIKELRRKHFLLFFINNMENMSADLFKNIATNNEKNEITATGILKYQIPIEGTGDFSSSDNVNDENTTVNESDDDVEEL